MSERIKILNINEKIINFSVRKYDLGNEMIAASASGMTSYADLDKRCITFTIHLDGPTSHDSLCRTLFDTTETYIIKLLGENPRISHTGLFSALDVNGSKFSGADRDPRQNHCHGSIFIPHGISALDVNGLLTKLRNTALMVDGVKCGPDAVQFALFDRHSRPATLASYINYAMKDAIRTDSIAQLAVALPFDDRFNLSKWAQMAIERRQCVILQALGGGNRFKVYR